MQYIFQPYNTCQMCFAPGSTSSLIRAVAYPINGGRVSFPRCLLPATPVLRVRFVWCSHVCKRERCLREEQNKQLRKFIDIPPDREMSVRIPQLCRTRTDVDGVTMSECCNAMAFWTEGLFTSFAAGWSKSDGIRSLASIYIYIYIWIRLKFGMFVDPSQTKIRVRTNVGGTETVTQLAVEK